MRIQVTVTHNPTGTKEVTVTYVFRSRSSHRGRALDGATLNAQRRFPSWTDIQTVEAKA